MGTLFLNCIVSPLPPKQSFRLRNKNDNYMSKKKLIVVNHNTSDSSLKSMAPYGALDTNKNSGQDASLMGKHNHEGIGIVNFLQGKTLLITGATGYLGKVLVEKILRSVPEIDKLYLMIKARKDKAAMEILKTEIINADVFKCLKQKYGQSYQNFMLSKLVPVVGNICESDLGLEATMANVISREVHVIINSAANTRFNERYDVSIDTNTRGTYHLMNFAKYCKNLSLFLQISSAYANGPRKGIIMEKKFSMGDTITGEKSNSENRSTSLPILNVEKEIQLAFDAIDTFQDNSLTQNLKKLGLERAERYGWHDTYAFTKAMGEMIIDSMRGEIPVVIIRPSIIESTYRDPFPGWIQGNRMLDPLMVYYGKGQLTCFLADPNCVVDIVPADTVVNATLAAVAKHGMTREPVINIYQVGSSVVNPLTLQELVTLVFEHFKCNPFLDSKGNPINVTAPMKLCTSVEEFSTHLKTDVAKQREFMAMEFKNSKRPEIYAQKLMELVRQLATIYKPYGFYKGRFDCSNLQGLMENMSEEEKIEFGFDVKSIDWGHYIKNVHVPGLRMHVMQSHKM